MLVTFKNLKGRVKPPFVFYMKAELITERLPKIVIDGGIIRAFNKLASFYSQEFTMLTHCKKSPNNVYTLYDYFFPKQKNTSVETFFEGTDQVDLMEEGADMAVFNGHIHSHVNMGISPSQPDLREIAERGKNQGVSVSVIINNDNKCYGHIYDYENGMFFNDVPVTFEFNIDEAAYEKHIVTSIKNVKSLESIRNILSFTKADFFNLKNQESEDELERKLKQEVKDKFTTRTYTTLYGLDNKGYPNSYNKGTTKSGFNRFQDEFDEPDERDIPYYSQHKSWRNL